jgi:hypothetical protein
MLILTPVRVRGPTKGGKECRPPHVSKLAPKDDAVGSGAQHAIPEGATNLPLDWLYHHMVSLNHVCSAHTTTALAIYRLRL